jgi:hypothetical protein
MLAATTANPADASKAVATNEFVQAAIQAAIASAVSALLPTGTVVDLLGAVAAPAGWVLAMQGTIGSAASGATIRANADCQNLYYHCWNGMANTEAPVTGGRGASANADWLANKPIGGLDLRGLVRATFDAQGGAGSGRLPAFPRVGVIGGEAAHVLTIAELASHGHGASGLGLLGQVKGEGPITPRGVGWGDGTNAGYQQDVQVTVQGTGGNAAHQNTQPTRTVTSIIKL